MNKKYLLFSLFLVSLSLIDSSVYAQVTTLNTPATGYKINLISVLLSFLAGLVLFLFGITQLSNGIKSIAKDRAKKIFSTFTSNRFAGVGTGMAVTSILDSSSVTIIMVIALVNGGALTFQQSIGLILGSNIGTTLSSQIIAFNLGEAAPLVLLIGFIVYSLSKKKKIRKIGQIIFGVGLIFFGLNFMGLAMLPLRNYPGFMEWMENMEHPLYGVMAGAAFTVVIQSSSATLGVLIAMASQGVLSLPAGIVIMMGAEIGTCADTLVATIGRTREAVKTGLFHLIFNLITVLIGILFVDQFTYFIRWISFDAPIGRQIANAHVFFNVLGVLLFIGFTPWIAKAMNSFIPKADDRGNDTEEDEFSWKTEETISDSGKDK